MAGEVVFAFDDIDTFDLTAREREVLEKVRDVVKRDVVGRAAAIDRESIFPSEPVHALAEAGLGGLLIPREYGGSGDSTVSYVLAMEEIAAACGSTSTVYMTQMHCAYPILLMGTEAQKKEWLPGLCGAKRIGSLGVTEPAAGSDAASMRTLARADGSDYVLDGTKTFITSGDRADVVVLFASIDRDAGRDGITAFLIDTESQGFSTGPPMHKLGMRGSSTSELFFDNCRVPAEALLGKPGQGWELTMASVVKSRLSAAAQGVGLARGAFEAALEWATERDLLKGSRGQAQVVQFALAEARAQIMSARQLLHATTRAVDGGGNPVTQVSMAKLICTDCGMEVAKSMARLLGIEGDLPENRVERYLRDAKITQIYDGTNEIQRLLIARETR